MTGRILILARSLPHHSLGGMEVLAWSLARAIVELGPAVSVITTALPGRSAPFIEDGVEIIALKDTPPGRYSPAWWAGTRSYVEQLRDNDVAAMLSVSAAGFGLLRLKKDRFAKTPFVMQAHGTSWGEIISKWRSGSPKAIASSARNIIWVPKDLRAYRQFDAVVAVGDTVMQGISAPPIGWVLPAAKRRLINNGIDTKIFYPSAQAHSDLRAGHGIAETTPVILSANRLHAQKGTAHGLHAFAIFARTSPAARYWIAGDGPELPRLQRLAGELGVQEKVSFLGRVDHADLVRYLQASDALLFLTERVEVGLPLNVLEALAVGLPAVVANQIRLFNSEYLHPVATRDHAAAAAALGRALATPPSARQNLLPTEFQLAQCAASYLNLFNELGGR